MSKPIVLQEDFSGGSDVDRPRYQLAKGKSRFISDLLPSQALLGLNETSGGLIARGRWARSMTASSGGTYTAAVGFAQFTSGSRLLVVHDNGALFSFLPAGSASSASVGTVNVPAHPPTFYRSNAFFLDINGVSAPQRYDGSTIATVGGSPPNAAVSTAWKDHLVIARSPTNRNRIWFSNSGDPNAWDTAADGQWLDATYDVQGLATVRNMILVFEEGFTERIRGDVIPGVVGSDVVKEPLFSVGCSDPSSVAVSDDYVVFANSAGIYLTDGIGLVDLTLQAGISSYYRKVMQSYSSTVTISGAIFNDWYVFSVMATTNLLLAGMLHVRSRAFVNLTNVKAAMLCSAPRGVLDTYPRLWGAERGSKNVAELHYMFEDGFSGADADGTAFLPYVETPYYMGNPGLKRWRHLYLSYELGSSGDTARLKVTAQRNRNAGAGTVISSTVPSGSQKRVRVPINKVAEGFSFKIEVVNESPTSFYLYAVEAEVQSLEPGRLG